MYFKDTFTVGAWTVKTVYTSTSSAYPQVAIPDLGTAIPASWTLGSGQIAMRAAFDRQYLCAAKVPYLNTYVNLMKFTGGGFEAYALLTFTQETADHVVINIEAADPNNYTISYEYEIDTFKFDLNTNSSGDDSPFFLFPDSSNACLRFAYNGAKFTYTTTTVNSYNGLVSVTESTITGLTDNETGAQAFIANRPLVEVQNQVLNYKLRDITQKYSHVYIAR